MAEQGSGLYFECRWGRDSRTYDRIGAGIRRPFVECVDAVVSRGVLFDEQLTDRLRVHPLAEPCGGNRMERDVFWICTLKRLIIEIINRG